MAKWSDYVIVAVKYDDDKKHISKVKTMEDTGEELTNETIILRDTVVNRIKSGTTFVTSYKGSNGKWQKGDDVGIVTIKGIKYIRTDGNSKESDNLGSLPEF